MGGSGWNDADAAAVSIEADNSINQGEKRIISAAADALSWMIASSTLADEDIAGVNFLPAVFFHSPPLSVGVTPVAAGALSFLVCHGFYSKKVFLLGF